MFKVATFGSVAIVFLSAFALYSTSLDTRRLAVEVDAKRRHKQNLISSIAVMKAERAHRSRPEAIEPWARSFGMRPARGEQFVAAGKRRTSITRAER